MMEMDSMVVILMAEVLAGLLLLAFGFIFVIYRRRSKEHKAATALINKLEANEAKRTKKLGERINENCEIERDKLRKITKEIIQCESDLYQQILKIFLKRDIALLQGVDHFVNKFAGPYCNILNDLKPIVDTSSEAELEKAKVRIGQLKKEGVLLSEQLQQSMETMDEITAEYTRVFSGTQSELELENSSKKMMSIFADAEKSIRSSFNQLETEK